LAQFLSLGSPVVVRADGIVRTDPLALTAPVLVLLAGALVAPVIAGPVVAVAERFARGSRGILPVLPLRQLSRRARAVAAAVLVMALAAGAVVLAGVFHVRGDEARVAAERTATGADLRLELPVRTTIDPGRPGAGATLLDGVPEVADAFPVLSGVASIGADAVPLLAGDVAAFAALPGVAPELSAAASGLSAGRPGAPLPAGTTSLSVRVELTPGVGIPDGLELGVGAWLADEHGGALRVELGIAPVAPGVVELTGDIPPAAEMLAIEFRPPALPPSTVIDLALDEVATGSGDHIAFDGATTTLTSESADVQRLLPQLRTEQPLPVVISTTLADRLGVAAGSDFTMRLNGVSAPLPLRVLAVVPRLPGMAQGPGILLDLQALEARAVALDGSVPAANQLWVTASDPDAAAPQIRAVLTQRARIVTPRTSSPAPLLEPALVLIETGVGVTVLLAILGFVAVASSIGQRRRAELAPLRSLGLSVARIRGARIIELAATAVIAVLLGGLAGLLTAALVVPGLVAVLT
ncbi:MAG TPA: hypothetical protein VNR36_08515, partial [Pseudolysinimonas sp.]|nr:hypothetical protein [Pseudolysinimonas sp.]